MRRATFKRPALAVLALVAFAVVAGVPRQARYAHRHAAGEPGHTHAWDGTRVALLAHGEVTDGARLAQGHRHYDPHGDHHHPHGEGARADRTRHHHAPGAGAHALRHHDHDHAHRAAPAGTRATSGRASDRQPAAERLDRIAGLAPGGAGRWQVDDAGVAGRDEAAAEARRDRAPRGAELAATTGPADAHEHWQAPFQLAARSAEPTLLVAPTRAHAPPARGYDALAAALRALRARSPPLTHSV